jgi:signal transduction histidine kinase
MVVKVRDTGPGIDPQQRDRIFDAFLLPKAGGPGEWVSR